MQSKIVILGTGGTIAGTAADAQDATGYTAATLSIQQLVNAVAPLAALPIECEEVAQIDSKDMDFATWQRLAQRCDFHLARADVAGVVVTHGTDTLEETAYFLHRVLAPAKPLVLTAAMRPATSLQADGPQNLLDAVTLVRDGSVAGVSVVLAGRAWAGAEVRKQHTHFLDAFDGGDAGPLALIAAGQVDVIRPSPRPTHAVGLPPIDADPSNWPRVEIVLNHVGAGGALVDAQVQQQVDGLVVAGTGNGTLSVALEAALRRAAQTGVRVLRASRCARGALIGGDAGALRGAGSLSAVQARVELILQLLAAR